jgi:mRNA interferase HigB
MRVIAQRTLRTYAAAHPQARASLETWGDAVKEGDWATMSDVQSAFSKAKVLNADRVRFVITGGDFRLIAAFDFGRKIVFVKFIGTHAEYDRIDALTVAQFLGGEQQWILGPFEAMKT